MPQTELWTIGRLLQWTTDYLRGNGSDSPRLDAEVLLAEALGCRRIDLYTAFDEVPDAEPRAAFRELVRRRAEGTPVAYLIGRREFYSLSFRVTPEVLIPRPETELLVVTLLDLAKSRPVGKPITIADVGTGSGIIAVCAAKHLRGCRVTAIDVSPAALEVARANAAEHGVAAQIELIESDLFTAVAAERRFDFVVSNPPYVSTAEMETLAEDVRKFEPHEALVAGPKGTEVIQSLIPQAAERLNTGGHLLVEISPTVHDAVRRLLEADERFQPGPTIKDLARLPRVVQAVRE
jgi:release factor glutamine methyltransferase